MAEDYYNQIKPEDVWIFPKVSSAKQRRYYDKASLVHPAKMPTFLVQKIITEYSKPGDIVLDPMAGIGTTLIEAVLLGRNAIGVEYEQKFVSIIELNLKSVEVFRNKIKGMGKAAILKGDSRQLSKVLKENTDKIDAVITSPPFEDNTSGLKHNARGKDVVEGRAEMDTYSKDKSNKEQLGNLSGETYFDAMLLVYKGCFDVLRRGGAMALVTKNFVRKGEMVRLDLDTIKLCQAAGFSFKERKYRKLETVSFWIRNARKKFYQKHPEKVSGDPFAEYEDVLVFEKKNAEAA